MSYATELRAHYTRTWGAPFWTGGPPPRPHHDALAGLELATFRRSPLLTYATLSMSASIEPHLELYLVAPFASDALVELLAMVSLFHRADHALSLGHTVDIGRPWLPGSPSTCLLVSLPYLDGRAIETCTLSTGASVRCLWLVPITAAERAFKREHGTDALEKRLEAAQVAFADPERPSVI